VEAVTEGSDFTTALEENEREYEEHLMWVMHILACV
jgi:hypothetical protein